MERCSTAFFNKLLGCQLAEPDSQSALVASRRVLLDDAPLGGAVDHRKSLGNQLGCALGVLRFQKAPHRADLVPEPSLAGPVDLRPMRCCADARLRGKCIWHE